MNDAFYAGKRDYMIFRTGRHTITIASYCWDNANEKTHSAAFREEYRGDYAC
jgi:hypothetical protein